MANPGTVTNGDEDGGTTDMHVQSTQEEGDDDMEGSKTVGIFLQRRGDKWNAGKGGGNGMHGIWAQKDKGSGGY